MARLCYPLIYLNEKSLRVIEGEESNESTVETSRATELNSEPRSFCLFD